MCGDISTFITFILIELNYIHKIQKRISKGLEKMIVHQYGQAKLTTGPEICY